MKKPRVARPVETAAENAAGAERGSASVREENEHAARIAAIRARVQASLDDPSPDLTCEEIDVWLDTLGGAN